MPSVTVWRGSPASNGGRGLKLVNQVQAIAWNVGSPASNGGRGLKLSDFGFVRIWRKDRPPAMAGAD